MGRWCSLYLPYADLDLDAPDMIAERLRAGITAMGYTLYDPFTLVPGKSYPKAVKMMVCDGGDGWISVTAAPEPESMMATIGLAQTVLAYDPFPVCLALALDEDTNGDTIALIEAYDEGEKTDAVTTLLPFARSGVSADDLYAVLTRNMSESHTTPARSDAASDDLFAALPDDIQKLAGGVNKEQAQRLAARLTQNLFGKLGGAPPGTGDLLRGGASAWDSAAGQRINALMARLAIPADWHTPDYTMLRDAYALYRRRERNPAMRLLPGDQAIIDTIPTIADYQPVYGGKSDHDGA